MNVLEAMALLVKAIDGAQRIAAAIKRAGEEGREHLTLDELRSFQRADDEMRAKLSAEIDRQRRLDIDPPI